MEHKQTFIYPGSIMLDFDASRESAGFYPSLGFHESVGSRSNNPSTHFCACCTLHYFAKLSIFKYHVQILQDTENYM